MIKLDMNKFIDDIKTGVLNNSKTNAYGDSGYNITNYIMNNQPNTRAYDYVNKDVYMFLGDDGDYKYIEDYGNGVPDYIYDLFNDMAKVYKKVSGK